MRAGVLLFLTFAALSSAASQPFDFGQSRQFLERYCAPCHQGQAAVSGFDITRIADQSTLAGEARPWRRLLERVRNSGMPPANAPAPAPELREQFVAWLEQTLHANACAAGPVPGPAPVRRLNRSEYTATIRDLLNIHINAGRSLPADGAGGEGFDNAAETLFLSPVHAEKYLEAAKQALDYAITDPKSRAVFLPVEPAALLDADAAARKDLETFLPRAFRRPAAKAEFDRYFALFKAAQKRGEPFRESMLYALRGVLISPAFLFRIEQPDTTPFIRPVGDYELAVRLSYFLWGTMPDAPLFDLASHHALSDPAVLGAEITRMLKDSRTREFAENFVEQWLNTRELGRDIKPDAKLFPAWYDAEIQSGMRYEPVLFFQELIASDLSLLNLIDSRFTILTNKLQKHYGLNIAKLSQQPTRVDLPEGSHRGGVLSMAAILAVSSYPHRTSPVLRGKWILDSMLGTPPPPPPPNVPKLDESTGAAAAHTVRERLELHRRNPVCASCHSRIDPLGFALDNYDVLGRWRAEDAGKPLDTTGALPDGTRFNGIDGLKTILLERKELFLRNLTNKMLAYALGRGLTPEDSCTVDHILARLKETDYSAQTLVREIVFSVPFRFMQPVVVHNESKTAERRR